MDLLSSTISNRFFRLVLQCLTTSCYPREGAIANAVKVRLQKSLSTHIYIYIYTVSPSLNFRRYPCRYYQATLNHIVSLKDLTMVEFGSPQLVNLLLSRWYMYHSSFIIAMHKIGARGLNSHSRFRR